MVWGLRPKCLTIQALSTHSSLFTFHYSLFTKTLFTKTLSTISWLHMWETSAECPSVSQVENFGRVLVGFAGGKLLQSTIGWGGCSSFLLGHF